MNHAQEFIRRLIKDSKLAMLIDDVDCIRKCLKMKRESVEEAESKLVLAEGEYATALHKMHVNYVKEQRELGHRITINSLLPTSDGVLKVSP